MTSVSLQSKEDDSDSDKDDYYTILGVSSTARLIEIKKSFRTLQRKVHPDSSHSSDTRHISAKLNEAYQILSNTITRLEYDLENGFKEKNSFNISKLKELRRRKAQKIRENMSASANRSRNIESNVISSYSSGKQIKNCGLIITKATYGFIDLEIRSKTYHNDSSESKIITGYDSASALATEDNNNNNNNNNLEHNIEYTIDVTDALQCMVIHRGQSGGYIEIDDGFNKSDLEGFYNPYYNENKCEDYIEEKRYLEIEYMFDRKYHYIKSHNLEYLCIPDQNHIVHLYDINTDINTIINESDSDTDDIYEKNININDEKDININVYNEKDINNTVSILKSAHSFTTFSPIIMQNNPITSPITSEIITLPSGKQAITSRPSLIGLKPFSEIEKLRNENNNNNNNGNNNNNNNNKNKIIKWSVALMVVGAIGGLGYYYVDKQINNNANNNNNIMNLNIWQESIILYVQKYWNWIIGNQIDENDKCNNNNKGNHKSE